MHPELLEIVSCCQSLDQKFLRKGFEANQNLGAPLSVPRFAKLQRNFTHCGGDFRMSSPAKFAKKSLQQDADALHTSHVPKLKQQAGFNGAKRGVALSGPHNNGTLEPQVTQGVSFIPIVKAMATIVPTG